MCAGHCPVERWTRLRYNVWRAVTVITTSYYDNSLPITLAPWKTSVKLVFSRPLVTRRLMPSVTVWTLTVCASVLSRRLSSRLLQLHTVGDSLVFLVWPLSVNKIVLTWINIFSATVLNGWVVHDSSLHSTLEHGHFFSTNISQGSVATHLRGGGIFYHHFTTNLLLSLLVNEFWKSISIWLS